MPLAQFHDMEERCQDAEEELEEAREHLQAKKQMVVYLFHGGIVGQLWFVKIKCIPSVTIFEIEVQSKNKTNSGRKARRGIAQYDRESRSLREGEARGAG